MSFDVEQRGMLLVMDIDAPPRHVYGPKGQQPSRTKKRRSMTDASSTGGLSLDGSNIAGLGALRALSGLEFHALPLLQ
jgi:hypothetical protein